MIKWFLAYFRIDKKLVCEFAKGTSPSWDMWHDYPDSTNGGKPWHFYTHTCKRCNKEFTI